MKAARSRIFLKFIPHTPEYDRGNIEQQNAQRER
jgi:hypothetical protein